MSEDKRTPPTRRDNIICIGCLLFIGLAVGVISEIPTMANYFKYPLYVMIALAGLKVMSVLDKANRANDD